MVKLLEDLVTIARFTYVSNNNYLLYLTKTVSINLEN